MLKMSLARERAATVRGVRHLGVDSHSGTCAFCSTYMYVYTRAAARAPTYGRALTHERG